MFEMHWVAQFLTLLVACLAAFIVFGFAVILLVWWMYIICLFFSIEFWQACVDRLYWWFRDIRLSWNYAVTFGGLMPDYNFLGVPYRSASMEAYERNLREDIRQRIIGLRQELLRAQYCREVLNNPMLTEEKYQSRLKVLVELEQKYPGFSKWSSPTKDVCFSENAAIDAFGSNEWHCVKRTLELTKEDVVPRKKFDNV